MSGGATGAAGRRWTKPALYLGTVAVYADMYVTQPVLPLLSRDFGVAPAKAGLTVSAVVLAIAIASPAHGALSDALGRKRVMAGATALLAVPTLLCAFAGSFGALVAWRAAQGLLIPGMTAVAVAYVGDEFEPRDVGAVVGGYIAASVAGGLASRVVSGAVSAHLGWRAAFALFAATTLAAAALMAAALPSRRPPAHDGRAGATGGMLAHLRDRRLAGAYLVGLTLFFGFIGVFTYLPYRLAAPPFGLSTGIVSSVYLVYVAGVVVSPVAGRLSGRIPPERLMAAGLALSVAGVGMTLLPSLAAVVAGLLVLCTGMFTAQSIAPSYVNVNARVAKGGASALYLAFYYAGGTLGSSLPGLAWQRWAWPGVVAACVAALLAGLAAVLLLCRPVARAV
jgi:MFS transporter, YNFM family, putative membrane transport protein